MIGPLTYLDVALIALAALSGLLAMYRGLTREILSILSWIVAAGAVAYFILYNRAVAEDIAKQIGAPVQIAQVAVGALLFVIVLVVVHLITSKISDTILDSNIGMIDRILGLVFGVARGFILIVIPFMLYENFFPDPKQQLPWVRNAVTLPYIKDTGKSLRALLVQYVPEKVLNPAAGAADEQSQWRAPAYASQRAQLARATSPNARHREHDSPKSEGKSDAARVGTRAKAHIKGHITVTALSQPDYAIGHWPSAAKVQVSHRASHVGIDR